MGFVIGTHFDFGLSHLWGEVYMELLNQEWSFEKGKVNLWRRTPREPFINNSHLADPCPCCCVPPSVRTADKLTLCWVKFAPEHAGTKNDWRKWGRS